MTHKVVMHRRVDKALTKLPKSVAVKFDMLVHDLRSKGPSLSNWPNYSELGPNRYHCRLKPSWVAVWTHKKGRLIVEVTYVGSRGKAPY